MIVYQVVCKFLILHTQHLITTMSVTTAIFLDTRRAKKGNLYPVKVRVTFQRKRKYYAIGVDLSEEDFQKVQGEKPRGEYKALNIKFSTLEARAIKVIEKLPEFSFTAFEKTYFEQKTPEQDVYSFYERYIQGLKEEGRVGTASSYQCSLNSFKAFHPRKLSFEMVTPDLL